MLDVLRVATAATAAAVLLIAVLVLVGWALDLSGLKRVASGFAPMKANSALAYVCLSLVLLAELHRRRLRVLPELLLAVAGVIGLVSCVEHAFGVSLHVDQLLVHDGELGDGGAPGRMSVMGAVCVLVLSLAVVALRRGSHRLSQLLALAVLGLSSVGLLGYLYGVDDLYRVSFFRGLAVHSGLCLLLLSLCVLFLDGDAYLMSWVTRDTPDGWAIRVLLPAAVASPVTLAYVVVLGVRHRWWTLPVAVAVAVPVMTFLCLLIVALIARRLLHVELERRRVVTSLQEAHEELGRRVEYAGIVAHDLRNPLSAIGVYANLLLDDRVAHDPERVQRHAATVVSVTETMKVILEDILSVARLEAGTLDLQRSRLELVDFLDTVQLQAELAYPGARIRPDITVGELWVEADAVQLTRVLLNLLSNAVKYSPAGGLVELRLSREQDTGVLRVVDHGPGIATDDVPVLFEKFSRLPSGSKVEGTGLGLFISRSIVEAHGGRLWVEDTPGGGATFCLSLAAAARRPTSSRPAQPRVASPSD